jgi:hypothetical protein
VQDLLDVAVHLPQSPEAKGLAVQNLAKVCRIGTHLFHFAEYVNALRGWGRGLRNAVCRWCLEQGADKLAYQVAVLSTTAICRVRQFRHSGSTKPPESTDQLLPL